MLYCWLSLISVQHLPQVDEYCWYIKSCVNIWILSFRSMGNKHGFETKTKQTNISFLHKLVYIQYTWYYHGLRIHTHDKNLKIILITCDEKISHSITRNWIYLVGTLVQIKCTLIVVGILVTFSMPMRKIMMIIQHMS
jgi:hypothetical protein